MGDCTWTVTFCYVDKKNQTKPTLRLSPDWWICMMRLLTHKIISHLWHLCLICVSTAVKILRAEKHINWTLEAYCLLKFTFLLSIRKDLLNLSTIVTPSLPATHATNGVPMATWFVNWEPLHRKLSSLLCLPWKITGGTKEMWWVDTKMDFWPFVMAVTGLRRFTINIFYLQWEKGTNTCWHSRHWIPWLLDCVDFQVLHHTASLLYLKMVTDVFCRVGGLFGAHTTLCDSLFFLISF